MRKSGRTGLFAVPYSVVPSGLEFVDWLVAAVSQECLLGYVRSPPSGAIENRSAELQTKTSSKPSFAR